MVGSFLAPSVLVADCRALHIRTSVAPRRRRPVLHPAPQRRGAGAEHVHLTVTWGDCPNTNWGRSGDYWVRHRDAGLHRFGVAAASLSSAASPSGLPDGLRCGPPRCPPHQADAATCRTEAGSCPNLGWNIKPRVCGSTSQPMSAPP